MWALKEKINGLLKKLWIKTEPYGFTCDNCGRELFDYPASRLCKNCESSLRFVGGKVCEKCGRETRGDGVCATCKQELPTFTRAFAPLVYVGDTALLINRMKTQNPRMALYLGEKMADTFCLAQQPKSVLLLFVPSSPARIKERGYNPSELLARSVEKRLKGHGIEVETDGETLLKRKETPLQKHMNRDERMENLQGAFHLHKRKICKDKTVLLVDDIMTTGATAGECARLIRNAGANEVFVLVAAALPERG